MTSHNINPEDAYFGKSAFEALGNIGKHVFKTEVILRAFFHRDAKTNNFFNLTLDDKNPKMIRTVIQGTELEAGLKKMSDFLGFDLFDSMQYVVYPEVQNVNEQHRRVFVMDNTVRANPNAKSYLIRAYDKNNKHTLHYTSTGEIDIAKSQRLHFFDGDYVRSQATVENPPFAKGEPVRYLYPSSTHCKII